MTKRVLLGKFPDGGYGLRISQPGYDVTSNPIDNEKMIFNSDWPAVLPVYTSGYKYLSAGETYTETFAAALGYVPFCSALVNIGRGWEQLSMSTALQSQTRTVESVPIKPSVDASPAYQYAWSGGKYTTFQIRAFSDKIILFCDAAIEVKWTVYRIRAF